ncbi:MAG: glutamate 5-kinase [Clostridia bacterium]|nr:glutamate 5-kinase [Clostridia bacterium]
MKSVKNAKRVVFKVGTSTLTHESGKLNFRRIERLARTLADLANSGLEVVLVSSAAISAGCAKLGITERPHSTSEKQAIAAVGQSELMKVYEHYFSDFGHPVGQILITKDELDREKVFENARSTFNTLIKMGCIPIVNENDSVSYDEIEFGDNDTLSAYVSLVCGADALVILSDIDGLYDSDPHANPDAKLIPRVDEITDEIRACAGGAGTKRGTGGLITKIHAADIVCPKGIPMYIINGADPDLLYDLRDGKQVGTLFAAGE